MTNAFYVGLAGAMLLALFAAGCATAPPLPKQAGPDPFLLERDLAGATVARGEFSAINGVRRGFTAKLDGAQEGAVFVLREDFVYDDGEKDSKTWRLTKSADGAYSGTREDVVGKASGVQVGRVFRLSYLVRLPGKDGKPGRKVRFQDVMAKAPDGTVLNDARVSLFGFRVGAVKLKISRAS
jgi:hypothetical protein